MPSPPVVEIKNLDFRYSHGSLKIDELLLHPGRLYRLYGGSDSGARELLLLAAGLVAPFIESEPAPDGRILRVPGSVPPALNDMVRILGRPILELDNRSRAQAVGMIFENPDWSILGSVVIEEFNYSFASAGLPLPSFAQLTRYGLREQRFQRTETLSGGEKHRLNCACALEANRRLIVADLSSSNLDDEFVEQLGSWLDTEIRRGSCVLIHGLETDQLESLGGEMLVMRRGHLSVVDRLDKEAFPSLSEQSAQLVKSLSRPAPGSQKILVVDEAAGPYSSRPMSLSAANGEVVVVKGRNGCGKTTLGMLTVGADRPASGRIDIDGASPVMAFQHPEHCFFETRIDREVKEGGLLTKCGISDSERSEHPRNLDRSRQKLLAVASALHYSRGLCVLDEPTCGMDWDGKKRFIDLVNHFAETAILIFTHDRAIEGIGRVVSF